MFTIFSNQRLSLRVFGYLISTSFNTWKNRRLINASMQLLGLIFSKDNRVWNGIEILSALLTIAVCNDSKIFNSLLSFVNYLPVVKVDPWAGSSMHVCLRSVGWHSDAFFFFVKWSNDLPFRQYNSMGNVRKRFCETLESFRTAAVNNAGNDSTQFPL